MDNVILDCTKKNKKFEAYRFFVEGNPKALLLLEVKSDTEADLNVQTEALIAALRESGLSYSMPVLRDDAINYMIFSFCKYSEDCVHFGISFLRVCCSFVIGCAE